jgi:CelD/BcsL family acetyltransferase involved in cellulose biosynthesis
MTADQVVADAPQPSVLMTQSGRSSVPTRFEIRALDPTCDAYWSELASSHPEFTVFHSSAWIRVLSKTYRHKPLVLYWSRNGRPAAALPLLEVVSPLTGRRGVSLPFTDSCKPLFFSGCNPSGIFEDVRTFAQRRSWTHFEIRGRMTNDFPCQPSLTFHGHSLDLRSPANTLFASFAASVRRAIRKAERSGLTVSLSCSEEALREFYRLHERTRRRHGLPPQPFSFFRNIHNEILKPGLGFIAIAKRCSSPVAAAVFLHTQRAAVFKFGASDERYLDLRPNNLVMWHGIRHLAENGLEKLHLGRTSVPNEGLRRFKLGWGATEDPIEYFRFDTRTNDWTGGRDRTSGFHNALLKRLPLIANRLLGAAIYPHLD